MKQSLSLRLGQQLTMTPQLQQAIRLLQLSTVELHTEVQEALESNLMLEVDDEGQVPVAGDLNGAGEDVAPADIPSELPVDTVWEDLYDAPTAGPAPAAGEDGFLEAQRSAAGTLQSHLAEQLNLLRHSTTDHLIATAIVDAIGVDGYLQLSLEEIHEGLLAQGLEVDLDEVRAVLRQVQNFDPTGVGARSIGECLALQLRELPEGTPWRDEAITLCAEHLDVLANRDPTEVMRLLDIDREELGFIMKLVQKMNPRPGLLVESEPPPYIVPDVFVRKQKGRWVVELNGEAVPRLRVNSSYASLVKRADSSADNMTLKSHLQEARWFIKSLRSRSETLLKVANCIVERQQAFLEHGEEAMKPMVLHDVAETVEMHESTISRVTNNKYMHTPRGIFELKYFFSSHVFTKNGSECSSTAIRALLKKLISAENPSKPLSDSKLASVLSEQGIKVARRTVAKYREAMSIPSSNERKSLS